MGLTQTGETLFPWCPLLLSPGLLGLSAAFARFDMWLIIP